MRRRKEKRGREITQSGQTQRHIQKSDGISRIRIVTMDEVMMDAQEGIWLLKIDLNHAP